MKYIKINAMPDKLAKEAYSKGFYIEAIQILHSYIENQCRSYLMLIGCCHFSANTADTWDLTDTIKFSECIKVLFILNKISRDDYIFHKSLNTLRNNIIHNICKEPYDKVYKGIPKKEYDDIFNKTLDNLYFFTEKCDEIVAK